MPYFVDDNNNKFELGTKITGDLKLHYIENPIDYSITYHLDGGINGDNPVSYNITDEPIYLNDASKEGYLFKGWFEDPNFNYDSLVTTIDPSQTLKSYQLYASFEWIKINPIVEFEPLALVYNGESQELVMANVEGGTITYSLDGVNYSANVPTGTNAGTYKVYYKIKGDSQHLNTEGNIEVTISKAVYDMSKISLVDKTVTYNGNEQGIEINGVLPSGVTVAYSGLGTNVGTYTIAATFTGDALNYEAIPDMSATLTIQKANLEYTLPKGKNLVFNDANQELVIPGSISLGTILYSLDDENYSKEIPAGKNVGNYVVYYKYDINNENYNDIPSGYVQSFISKGEVVYTLPTPKELTYNGLAQELIRAGSINAGSIEYSLDGSVYSENIPTATNAGSYIVYYRFAYDKTNYNQVEDGNVVTVITKANPTLVAPTAKELTYTGSALALIHAGSVNAGTLVYSLDGENYKEELPQATNAGSYTVYYKVNGNDNYNDIVFETLEVTIAKATHDMSQITMTDSTVTYDGLAHGIEITGVLPTGVIVEYSGLGTNAGTYTIVATFTGDALNYEAISNMSATLTIEKANPTLVAPTAKTLTYTGSQLLLIHAGSTNAEAIEYSLDDTNYSIDVPTAINAGEYTVYYRVVGGQNYKDIAASSITVTINKANVSKVNPKLRNLIYTGEELELAIAGSISVGSVEYSLDGIVYSENIPTATNAGSYIVYYRFVYDKTNYNQVEDGNFTTIIAKANPTLVAPTAKELTYTGSLLELIYAGSVNAGTLVYSLDGENYKEELPQATNAGSYTVYYKVNGNDNYNDIAAKTFKVTIAKATYDMSLIEMADKEVVYNGTEQGITITGELPEGVTVSYSGLGINVGTYTIVATFTGDALNYEAISNMSATLTIKKASLTGVTVNGYTGTIDGNSHNIVLNKNAIAVDGSEVVWQFSQDGIHYVSEISVSNVKESGTYYYKATAINHEDATGTFVVVISEKIATTIEVTNLDSLSKTYDGNEIQDPIIHTNSNGEITITYSVDGINYVSDKPVDANIYKIKVEIAETAQYTLASQEFTITISKKELTITGIVVSDKPYDSTTNATVSNYGELVGVIGSDEVEMNIANTTANFASKDAANNILVTITGYELTGVDKNNYSLVDTWTGNANISKADLAYTIPVAKELTYTGSLQVLVNAGSVSAGRIEYSLDNVTYSEALPQGMNAGSYTVYYRYVIDETNYNTISRGSVEVQVAKATPTYTTPTAKTGLVYNSSSQALVNAGSVSAGQIEYSLDDVTYTETLPQGMNAGSYTVYYRYVIDETNYNTISSGSVDVQVAKATYDMSGVSFTDASKTYTGSAQSIVITGELPEGVTALYTGSGINVGLYEIEVSFTGDATNYEAIPNMSATLTITKASLTFTNPTAKTGLVYNSSSQALVNAGSISAGSIEYSTNGINYTNEIPAMINAGTYTVYYRYEVDSVNYDTTGLSDSNIKVTIAKATYDMSGVSFTDASKTYTGSAQGILITGELPEGVSVEYSG